MSQERLEPQLELLPPDDEKPRPMTGSEIRDHLANERTYLAWLRTAVGLLGLGFLVARLRIELAGVSPESSKGGAQSLLVALGFAALGVVTLFFSTWRYLTVRRMIETGRFAPLGHTVLALSVGVLGVALLVILYLVHQLVS